MDISYKTYRDLLIFLQSFSEGQLDQTATIFDFELDEFQPVIGFLTTDKSCDVFDPGQILLEVL